MIQLLKSAIRRRASNKPKLLGALTLSLAIASAGSVAGDYVDSKAARDFTQRMVEQHGFDAAEVRAILAGARKQQAILDAIARPAEKSKPWYEYRNIFLDERRIADGVAFWVTHAETLRKAEKVYGVAPEVIVAIIGVETRYGTVTGRYRVLDALATLGFDYPPHAAFFSKELEHFLLLTKEQKQDVHALKGSYAGAMGYGQFMPSSYRAYAADFDGDGLADIWSNPVDAIGSVANYFKVHGWQPRQLVMAPAVASDARQKSLINKVKRPDLSLADLRSAGYRLADAGTAVPNEAIPLAFEGEQGMEFWLGFNNFYVITRYNRSPLYARAVWELSEAIKTRKAEAAL